MKGTQVRSLAWEDFTCHWAAKLRALEPVVRNKREAPQVESSPHLPQLEKAHWKQWRPTAAIDKLIKVLKKDILTYATTWMNLEDIMASAINQTQKNECCIIPLIWDPRVVKLLDTESGSCLGQKWGDGKLLFIAHRVSFWKGEKVLEMDGGSGCKAVWMYSMLSNCTLKNG